jgi:hypothetical protein
MHTTPEQCGVHHPRSVISSRESKLAKIDQSVRSSNSGSSEEDFLASDKDWVLPSDLSHLGSISVYSDVSGIFAEATNTNKDPGATDQEEDSTEDPSFSHENQESSLKIPGVALSKTTVMILMRRRYPPIHPRWQIHSKQHTQQPTLSLFVNWH